MQPIRALQSSTELMLSIVSICSPPPSQQYHTLKLRVDQMEAEDYVEKTLRPLLTRFSMIVTRLNRAVDFEQEVSIMAFNATSSSDHLHTTWKQVGLWR